MNILIVSHEKNVHGSTRSLISMVEGLKKQKKLNITVLLPGKGSVEKELQKYDIQYYKMQYYENYKNCGKIVGIKGLIKEIINLFAVLRLIILLKKWDINIVHSNSSAVDVGIRAALPLKIAHIYHFREFMEEDFGFTYRNHKRMKRLVEKSNYVIFISDAIKEKYIKKYKIKNYSIIYNGFILEDYYENRKDLFKGNNINILLAGTISKNKGVENAIRAVHYLKNKKLDNIKLFIIGDGNKTYIKKLNSQIKEKHLENIVKIKGYHDDLRMVRKRMDIALMCSNKEAFGRVTVEAMLAGLLVVGKAKGGTLEIISDRINGVLYYETVDLDLEKKLEAILLNKEKYIEIATYGQKDAKLTYDNIRNAKKIYKIYNIVPR